MASLEQLLEGPGLEPPPGVRPNFINPQSQSAANLACNILCLTIATICVAIRMYTRFVITRSHGWEDYTCAIAWLGLVAYTTLMFVPIFAHNAGIHQWDIQVVNLIRWTKVANGIEIAYIPIMFITKLSILLLFLRIFVPNGRTRTYWIIQGVILFNFLFYLANLPVEIWPCVPRSKLWNPTEPGHCINNEDVFVAGGTINVVSDFTILLLPIVQVWRLQMSTERKIGVSAVFATGLFACISSIMHLVTSVVSAKKPDKTYYLFPVALWTVAEIASGIVCGCLITMPHFFHHFGPKIAAKLSSARHSRGTSTATSNGPARKALGPEWRNGSHSAGAYDSGHGARGKDTYYMELEETGHHWQQRPQQQSPQPQQQQQQRSPISTVGHRDGDHSHHNDNDNDAGKRSKREWDRAHLPSQVTSIYSDDFPEFVVR